MKICFPASGPDKMTDINDHSDILFLSGKAFFIVVDNDAREKSLFGEVCVCQYILGKVMNNCCENSSYSA